MCQGSGSGTVLGEDTVIHETSNPCLRAGRVPWAKNLSREGGIQGLRGGSWEFGFGHVELDSAGRHLGT